MKPKKFHSCIAKGAGTCSCSLYKSGRFCNTHRSQYRVGLIDINGNKIREKEHYHKPVHYEECLAKNSGTGECSESYKPGSRFCARHKWQKKVGIIDNEGKKIRDKIVGTQKTYTHCIAKNSGPCGSYKGGRYCYRHHYQWKQGVLDDDGNKTGKELKLGRFHKCIAEGKNPNNLCSGVRKGRWCFKHQAQYHDGLINSKGELVRNYYNGPASMRKGCSIPGCQGVAGFNGFCRKHYMGIIIKEQFERFPSIIPMSKHALVKEEALWHQQ